MVDSQNESEMQTVYLYDTTKTAQPLTGSIEQNKDTPLKAGQTVAAPKNGRENFFNGSSWTDKLATAYAFDPTQNNLYTGSVIIPEGQELKANQTFVKPKDGLYWPLHFNGVEWVGITKEEYEKEHPAPTMPVSATTLAMNALGEQVAQAKVQNDQQDKSINDKIDKLTQSVNVLGQMIAKQQTTTTAK